MRCSKSHSKREVHSNRPTSRKRKSLNLILHFKELEKDEETKCKASKRKAIKGRDLKKKIKKEVISETETSLKRLTTLTNR